MAIATARELREQARACLQLAKTTKEYYAKKALVELAHDLSRQARQEEFRERGVAALSKGRLRAA